MSLAKQDVLGNLGDIKATCLTPLLTNWVICF